MTKTGKYIVATVGAILAYNLIRGQSAPAGGADYSFLGSDCSTPRGIRNNNPGNLKTSASSWLGKVPHSENQDYDCSTGQVTRTFEQFTAYKYGIRAMVKLLQNYMQVKNLRTISQIINRWAPSTENNPAAYINFVSNYTGYAPNWPLSPSRETFRALSRAIARYENGTEAISDGQFAAVWNEFFADGISGTCRPVSSFKTHGDKYEVQGRRLTPNVPARSHRVGKKKMVLAVDGAGCASVQHYGHTGYRHNYSDKARKDYCRRSAAITDAAGNPTKDDVHSANFWAREDLWNCSGIDGIPDSVSSFRHGMVIETTSPVPFIKHWGIILEIPGGLFIAHNTPYRGVVVDTLADFFRTRNFLAIKNQFYGLEFESVAHFLGKPYDLIRFNCYDFIDSVAFYQATKSYDYAKS